jgi:D-threo-aldose 1-dehydrogenase
MTTPGRVPSPQGTQNSPPHLRFRPPRFGLGGSTIGDLAGPDGEATALATIDAAYRAGIRFFDTAPQYGLGRSERRFGTALARRPRGEYLLSTKVGRRVTPAGLRLDFSAPGVRRSLTESLGRLAVESVDLVFLQDPQERWRKAMEEVYPALHELREHGTIRAIGVATDQWRLLDRFVRDTEVDAVLLAGRYSVLDQSGQPLLDRCLARGVAAILADVLPRQADEISEDLRARRIAAVCERYGVSLPQAALAFPARHPAVTSVLIDAASAVEIRADAALVRQPVPAQLWRDLEEQELVTRAPPS